MGGQDCYGAKGIPPSGVDEPSSHACHAACRGADLHGCHGEAENLLPDKACHRHTLSRLRHVPRDGLPAAAGCFRLAALQSRASALYDGFLCARQPRNLSSQAREPEGQGLYHFRGIRRDGRCLPRETDFF